MTAAQSVMKDVLLFTLGKHALYGGVKFHLDDTVFDRQEVLVLLPKIVTIPMETIVSLLSAGLSEKNKDSFVGSLANVCCEIFEVFINQVCYLPIP
jgi:hypothetical protein